MRNRLCLHVPSVRELGYREKILSDPDTMSYNRGYDLGFEGYHRDTGCIDFPESEWQDWHAWFIGREPERFYAYVQKREDSAFVGEVNLHRNRDAQYDMGIVIEAGHRGNGYGEEALGLLLQYAFETMKADAVRNDFEEERDAALKAHLACGFREDRRENGIVHLLITAEEYWDKERT